MSINLITDGWLYPIRRIKSITAPDAEGITGSKPTTPCSATGGPVNPPPATPTQACAIGPEIPTVPCGPTAVDPTINPPTVPVGQEGSEVTGTEAPAVPQCPKGEEE